MLIQSIVDLDKQLLLFLNSFHNEFFDTFMWMLSTKEICLPLYLVIIYYFFKNVEKRKAFYILGACIVCIVLCDQIASSIFKPLVERLRPSRDESISDLVHIVNGYTGGKFGFFSSHAANVFGLAVFSSLVFKNRLYSISIILWASLVSYSRIYLGVHFPGDVLCGIILGILLGYFSYKTLNRFVFFPKRKKFSFSYYYIVFAVIFFSIIIVSKYIHFTN